MERAYLYGRRKRDSYAHDKTDWKAGTWAGAIGALVFMMAEMPMAKLLWGKAFRGRRT
jgi:hypothetical protein